VGAPRLRGEIQFADALAVLAILLLVLLFNPDLAFRGMVPGGLDVFVYFYPLRAYLAQGLAEGRLPLWNPHLFLGSPFLANPQTAVFYPGTLLFGLLPVPRAYVANLLAHLFLAAASLYAFARWSLRLGRLGSVLGASAFAFSGFMGGQSGHINQLSVAAWLPALALALDVALSGERRTREWALAALFAGLLLQLLAGHPQEVYMTLAVLVTVAAWRRWADGPAALARGLGVLALASGLAFGAAAIQLVPTLELSRLSIRGGGLDFREATFDSLPWRLLLPALFPGFWEHLHTTEFYGHTGTIVLALAWLGLVVGPGRPAVLGATLVVLGLGLAVGDLNPLYHTLFDWAPGFASFRVPARWLFVYTFGASLLVAVGASWLNGVASSEQRVASGRRITRSSLLAARFFLFGLGAPALAVFLVLQGERQSRLLLVIWGGLAALSVLLVAVVLVAPRVRAAALGVLIVGGLVELWLAGADLEHRHPIPDFAYAQPRESTLFLQSRPGLDGRYRMLSIATPEYEVKETPEYREHFGWLNPEALTNLLVAVKLNETLTPNVPLEYGMDTADGYDGGVLPLAGFVRLGGAMLGPDRVRPDGVLASRLDHLPERRWLDLLGVRYILAGRVKDLIRGAIYFDRAVTARLRPGQQLELHNLPGGQFNRLGLISSFVGQARAGQEVGRLVLGDEAAGTLAIPLLNGTHTAVATADPLAAGGLERVQEWGASDPSQPADWIGEVRFARRPVRVLTIANSTPDLVLELRALNLVDDAREAAFPLTLDDSLERTEFFDVKVYERRDALPRVFTPRRSEIVDDETALRRLADPSFEPRDVVLLAQTEGAAALDRGPTSSSSATLELSTAEHLRVRAAGDSPGYLVLSDSWYPGWRATVDGRDAPIVRANVMFRAVPVSAGEHLIELTYEPQSFRLGAGVSAGSLLVGIVLWWGARRWRQRRSG